MAWLFAGLSYLIALLALPFLVLHPKMRGGLRQRLAHYPPWPPATAKAPRIWLHGASAGDVLALVPTVVALRKTWPEATFVLSCQTRTGIAMARNYRSVFDTVLFCPLDVPHIVRRAMRRIKPSVLVLEYTELWPNLMGAARAQRVPILLHNGRIGRGRAPRYRLLFFFTGNLLMMLDRLLLRDALEAQSALALGAPANKIFVTGNTKFDNLALPQNASVTAALRAGAGWSDDAAIWVAGSTHEGEDEALIALYSTLKKSHASLRMVLAPRYPERAEKLAAIAARQNLRVGLRKALSATCPEPLDVLVLDTVGELTACYAMARVVFVGGSFVPRGGQNILEPAALGRPVLFGPHMHNFRDALGVLLGRGGIQVATVQQLGRVLADLLPKKDVCDALGAIARQQVLATRGAAARNAGHIQAVLADTTPPT
jgi:3-deoxy-D-manno-octulosonic-acid transferase